MALFPPQVKNEDVDFGWGVVINFSKKSNVKVSLDWCVMTYVQYICMWLICISSFRAQQTLIRYIWWRFCFTVVRTV